MTDFRALLAFAAFVVYALLLAERGFRAAVAPFCSVAGAALFFTLFGCFGALTAAGWLWYLGALAALGWLVLRWAVRKAPLPHLGFGFWLFVGGGLWVLFAFWARGPMFSSWDEFSTWGTGAKLTQLFGEYYTTAPVGWPWPATNQPGLASLVYCVQFWGSGQGVGSVFREWQVYAAYDWLLLSVLSLLVAPFGKKNWNIAVPVVVIGFLTPFVFTHYGPVAKVSAVYLDSLADVPMGFLFGAALLAYFGAKELGWRETLTVCLALALLTMTKDMGFALGLVAAVLMLLDMLLRRRPAKAGEKAMDPQETLPETAKGAPPGSEAVPGESAKQGRGRAAAATLGRFSLFVGVVVGGFLLWAVHLQFFSGVSRFNLGGTGDVGIAQLPLLFLSELFSPQKSELFTTVMGGAPGLFLRERTTVLGPGAVVVAAILLVAVFAALIAKNVAQRRRCVVFAVFSPLGFAAYFLFILLTYIYIFRPEQAFASFERYLYPYYIGWFLAAVCLLGQSAKHSRLVVEGKAAILALCAVLGLRVGQFVPMGYSVLGFHGEEFAYRRGFARQVDALTAQLPENSKTYIVSQGDDGLRWFIYCYEFLPYQVDYGHGGGTMALPGALPEDTPLYYPATLEEWEQALIDDGVTHVLLDATDPLFEEGYGALFSDGLKAYHEGKTRLYAVERTDGGVTLVPLLTVNGETP